MGLFVGTRVTFCSGEGLALSRRHSISWAKGGLSLTQYLSGGTWRRWQLVLSLSVFTHTCLHIHPWENWINNRYITGIAQFVLHRDNVYQPYFTWHIYQSRTLDLLRNCLSDGQDGGCKQRGQTATIWLNALLMPRLAVCSRDLHWHWIN